MANGADGSIHIDTELDRTGFEQGSAKLLASIQDLTGAVDNLGDNMMTSFQQVIPLLQQIAQNTAQIYSQMVAQGQQATNMQQQLTQTLQRQAATAQTAAQQTAANTNAQQAAQDALRAATQNTANTQQQAATTMNTAQQQVQAGMAATGKEAQRLTAELEKIQRAAQNGFDNGSQVLHFKDLLDSAGRDAEILRRRLDTLRNSRVPTEDYKFLQEEIGKASERLAQLKDQRDRLAETGTKYNSKTWRKLEYDIDQVREQLATYKAERSELLSRGMAFTPGTETDEYKSLSSLLQQTEEQLARNRALISAEALEQAQLNLAAAQEKVIRAGTTEEQATAISELRQAQTELRQLADSIAGKGIGQISADAVIADQHIIELNNELRELVAQQKEMQSVGMGPGYQEYDDAAARIVALRQEINQYQKDSLRRNALDALGDSAQIAHPKIARLAQELEELKARQRELEAAGVTVGYREYDANALRIGEIQSKLTAYQNGMTTTKEKAEALAAAIGRVGKAALGMVGNIYKSGFKSLASGFEDMAKKILHLDRSSKTATLSSNGLVKALTGLKTMLKSRIKRMFISYLMTELKNAFSALAQFSSTFNNSISSMRNATTGLAGNLAVSVSNLVNAIAPAITAIINMISKAISYLNAFFALLGGKKTVIVAKKQNKSYADSLKSVGSAAKEAEGSLADFDEITTIDTEGDSGGGGGGGGGGAGDGTDMFEEVPIDSLLPEDVAEWFNRIKEAFEAQDWYSVGHIIAEGLNKGIQYVDDWINNVLRPKGVMWASRLAQILNGLVDGLDATLIGKTIADALNAGLAIVNTFLQEFDWMNFGKKIADGINGMIHNINWGLLGKTLANYLNAFIDTLYGIVHNIDWSGLGKSFADGFSGFVLGIHWDVLADLIAEGINGLVDAAWEFLENTRWDDIATVIGQNVNRAVGKINWEKLGRTLTEGLNVAVRFLVKFIETINWFQLGASLMTALAAAVKQIDWHSIGKLLSDILVSAGEFAIGALSAVDWAEAGAKLVQAIEDFLSGIDWGKVLATIGTLLLSLLGALVSSMFGALGELVEGAGEDLDSIGADIVGGLLKGIGKALKDIGSWIQKNVIDPIIKWFKDLLGISSPSTVFEEIGDDLIAGLLQGISNTWSTITEFFSESVGKLIESFSTWWEDIKSKAGQKWEEIKTSVTEKWEATKEKLSTTADNIKKKLSDTWEEVKKTAGEKWESLKQTVTQKWEETKEKLSTTADNIKKKLSETWEETKQNANEKWESLKQTVTQKWEETKEKVSTTADSIKKKLTDAWEEIKRNASEKWQSIKEDVSKKFEDLKSKLSTTGEQIKTTIKEKWEDVKSTASTKWNDIKSEVTRKWEDLKDSLKNTNWAEVGSNLVSGIKKGISGAWSSFKTWAANKFQSLIQTAENVFQTHSPSKVFEDIGNNLDKGLMIGIQDENNGVLATARTLAENVIDTVEGAQPDLTLTGNAAVDGLNSAAATLSIIAESLLNITNALDRLGGMTMPDIAAGTVIPYRTRLAPESYNSSSSDDGLSMNEILATNTGLLEQMVILLSSIESKDYSPELSVDGKVLANTVIKQINARTRQAGKPVILI